MIELARATKRAQLNVSTAEYLRTDGPEKTQILAQVTELEGEISRLESEPKKAKR